MKYKLIFKFLQISLTNFYKNKNQKFEISEKLKQ